MGSESMDYSTDGLISGGLLLGDGSLCDRQYVCEVVRSLGACSGEAHDLGPAPFSLLPGVE